MLWFKTKKPSLKEIEYLLDIKSTQLKIRQALESVSGENHKESEDYDIYMALGKILYLAGFLCDHTLKKLPFLDPSAYSVEDIERLKEPTITNSEDDQIMANVLASQNAIEQIDNLLSL